MKFAVSKTVIDRNKARGGAIRVEQLDSLIPRKFARLICDKYTYVQKTPKPSYLLTPEKRTRLIRYICVLALLLSNFSLCVNDFASDMGMSLRDTRFHFGQVGCKFKEQAIETEDDTEKGKAGKNVQKKSLLPCLLHL